MNESIKTPWHLWAVGIGSLLWNAGGGFDYVMTVTENEAYLGQFTAEQLAYFQSFPVWVVAAWALAVWSAVAGSVLLLLRSRFAEWAFWISLVAMAVTAFHNFVLSETSMADLMGPFAIIFSLAIVILTILFALYAAAMRKRGVLR